jgi:hypothetical protein
MAVLGLRGAIGEEGRLLDPFYTGAQSGDWLSEVRNPDP